MTSKFFVESVRPKCVLLMESLCGSNATSTGGEETRRHVEQKDYRRVTSGEQKDYMMVTRRVQKGDMRKQNGYNWATAYIQYWRHRITAEPCAQVPKSLASASTKRITTPSKIFFSGT